MRIELIRISRTSLLKVGVAVAMMSTLGIAVLTMCNFNFRTDVVILGLQRRVEFTGSELRVDNAPQIAAAIAEYDSHAKLMWELKDRIAAESGSPLRPKGRSHDDTAMAETGRRAEETYAWLIAHARQPALKVFRVRMRWATLVVLSITMVFSVLVAAFSGIGLDRSRNAQTGTSRTSPKFAGDALRKQL